MGQNLAMMLGKVSSAARVQANGIILPLRGNFLGRSRQLTHLY